MAELPLARDFPAADAADWRTLVEQALKGASFASLQSRSYDGIVVEPLYARAADAHVVPGRAPGAPWEVIQRIEIADGKTANAQILDDLNNGANGFAFVCQGSVGDYGYSMPPSEAPLKAALDGIELDTGVTMDLHLGPLCKDAALMVANYIHMRGFTPSEVTLRFGFDPIGVIAVNGWDNIVWPDMAHVFARLVEEMQAQGFKGPFAVGDGRIIHAAGGSEAQELAFALAAALCYVRAAHGGGVPLDAARRAVFFRLAADQNQFLTIAKFRALRKLWSRVEEACGLTPEPAFVSAETAWRMMTKRDAYGNIVRGTIAAFAAAVGGANAVTVLPFSAALGLPDSFARRVARNTQIILLEESNLYRVEDPAAGSGAIEALTDELCEAAWALFQDIEAAGGPADALRAGSIQRAVAEVRAKREAAAAKGRDPLVGTSNFPDLAEEPVSVLDAPPSMACVNPGEQIAEPLTHMRLAETFEALRDQSDDYLAKQGKRPAIFLACLGRPADFNARASFAKSLFEAGGIAAVSYIGASASPLPGGERPTPQASGEGDELSPIRPNPSPGPSPSAPARPLPLGEVKSDIAALAKAFKDSGARLACLCSSDKVYGSEGPKAAKALKAAGAEHIYLAGRPKDGEADLRAGGVESFVFAGGDMLTLLTDAHAKLGSRENAK